MVGLTINIILCCYWPKISKCPHLSAEQVKLHESNDKLEREGIEMANELPQDPEEVKGDLILISHDTRSFQTSRSSSKASTDV